MRAAVAVAALAGLASAAPASKQAINDATILNYALTLEHLESTFYRQALANFTSKQFSDAGFPEPFYTNLQAISSDENTHVSFLTSALQAAGATPVAECVYNFPVSSPKDVVAFASIVEGVGVSAYLGAAQFIANKDYLTYAGSVLTVEARHSSYIRKLQKRSPFPTPFDTPLTFNEVYSLVAPFFVTCPKSNPTLPVTAFPALTVAKSSVKSNDLVYFQTSVTSKKTIYLAFITVTGPVFVAAHPTKGGYHARVPTSPLLKGQVYVVLTSDNSTVSDDNTLAGPAIIDVAP